MKISLSPEIERLIAEKVESGRYRSADEVVREGLELLEKKEETSPQSSAGGVDIAVRFETIRKRVLDSEWTKLPSDLSKNVDHYLYAQHKKS